MSLRYLLLSDLPEDEFVFFPSADFALFWGSEEGSGYYQVWVTVLVQERATINLQEVVELQVYLDIIDFRGSNRHSRREFSTTYYPEDLGDLPEASIATLARPYAEVAQLISEEFSPLAHDIDLAFEQLEQLRAQTPSDFDDEPPIQYYEPTWEKDPYWNDSHSARS